MATKQSYKDKHKTTRRPFSPAKLGLPPLVDGGIKLGSKLSEAAIIG